MSASDMNTTPTTSIADGWKAALAELDALHSAYMAELDAADEADAIAKKMFARPAA